MGYLLKTGMFVLDKWFLCAWAFSEILANPTLQDIVQKYVRHKSFHKKHSIQTLKLKAF